MNVVLFNQQPVTKTSTLCRLQQSGGKSKNFFYMGSPVRTDRARTGLIQVQVRMWTGGQTGQHISASLQTLENGKVMLC